MFKDLPGYLTGQNVPILQRRPGRFTHLRRELL
jgi:hypothetical protein